MPWLLLPFQSRVFTPAGSIRAGRSATWRPATLSTCTCTAAADARFTVTCAPLLVATQEAVASAGAASTVWKVQLTGAAISKPSSERAVAATVTVYVRPLVHGVEGVKVSVLPDQAKTPAPLGETEKAACVTALVIGTLKLTLIAAVTPTPAPVGSDETTAGAAALVHVPVLPVGGTTVPTRS